MSEVTLVLKGVGKRNGDGWKDVTQEGEVVYVWAGELPKPYAPGQYRRIGVPFYTASTEQYEFTPVPLLETTDVLEKIVYDLRSANADLRDKLRVTKP